MVRAQCPGKQKPSRYHTAFREGTPQAASRNSRRLEPNGPWNGRMFFHQQSHYCSRFCSHTLLKRYCRNPSKSFLGFKACFLREPGAQDYLCFGHSFALASFGTCQPAENIKCKSTFRVNWLVIPIMNLELHFADRSVGVDPLDRRQGPLIGEQPWPPHALSIWRGPLEKKTKRTPCRWALSKIFYRYPRASPKPVWTWFFRQHLSAPEVHAGNLRSPCRQVYKDSSSARGNEGLMQCSFKLCFLGARKKLSCFMPFSAARL